MIYGKRLKIISVSLFAVIALGVGAALLIYNSYSSLAESDRKMVQAYKQYEALVKPQRDLVPDLIEIVRDATFNDLPEYEELQAFTERVVEAKQITEAVAIQNQFITTLDRVISVADSYPQLRAGQEYSMVLEEFRAYEGRAALERLRYNEAAAEFNSKLRSFPCILVSQVFNVSDRSFLKAPGQLAHSLQPMRG
jgi:LemA protein